MIRTLFKGLGRFALTLATMAFLAAVSLFVLGGFLLTWPILRLSPRDRKIKATMDLAQSAMTMLTVFSQDSVEKMMAEALEEPEPEPEPEEESETYISEWQQFQKGE